MPNSSSRRPNSSSRSSSSMHKDRSYYRSSNHHSRDKYKDNSHWSSDRGRSSECKSYDSKSEHHQHHYKDYHSSHHDRQESNSRRSEERDARCKNWVNRVSDCHNINDNDNEKRSNDISVDRSAAQDVPHNQNAPSPVLSNRISSNANCSSSAASDLLSPSQIDLTNLPKLIFQLANTPGLPDLSALPPQEAIRTLQQALQLARQAKQRSANQQIQRQTSSNSSLPSTPAQNHGTIKESPSTSSSHHRLYSSASQHSANVSSHGHSSHHNKYYNQKHPHTSQSRHHNSVTNHHYQEQQQHSYSHHESADGIRHELDLFTNKNWAQSPESDISVDSPTRGPSSSISSIPSGIGSTPLKQSIPLLTPSLANYCNDKLIQHTLNWPSEQIEEQIKKLVEDAHRIGSLDSTRVSAELKMARSLVRLTEIQATLQEQRILYIRRQIKEVEDWKGQSNNFASHS